MKKSKIKKIPPAKKNTSKKRKQVDEDSDSFIVSDDASLEEKPQRNEKRLKKFKIDSDEEDYIPK